MTKIVVAILRSKTATFEKFMVQLKGTAKPPAKVCCVICFLKNCTIKRKVRVSTVIGFHNQIENALSLSDKWTELENGYWL